MTPRGPCRAAVRRGEAFCRWHDPSPEARERHTAASKAGGQSKAYGALAAVGSIAEAVNLSVIDLRTPDGLRELLAGALRQLAQLPFDVRIANSLAQVAGVQRVVTESASLDARLAALEAAQEASATRQW